MSAITNFFGAIVSLVAAFFGSILGIFNKKKGGEFFLEIDSSKEGASKPQPAKAAVAAKPAQAKATVAAEPAQVAPTPISAIATESPQAVAVVNQALNMPAPTVSIEPLNIPKFGPARRPGSNMKSFLDMAKSVRS